MAQMSGPLDGMLTVEQPGGQIPEGRGAWAVQPSMNRSISHPLPASWHCFNARVLPTGEHVMTPQVSVLTSAKEGANWHD